MWDRRWGAPPSERPETYWQPWLGSEFGLRPGDLGELTPYQLDACRDAVQTRGD